LLGLIIPSGTGDTDILIDEKKIMESISNMETIDEEIHEEFDEETKDNICSLDNLEIDFTMPDIDKSLALQKMDLSIKIV
jgi:hypothetical protein